MRYLLILLLLLLLLLVNSLSVLAKEKEALQACKYRAMIASTTQQTRIDYYQEKGVFQAWETFLKHVSDEMTFTSEGLLKIAKGVFFDYPTDATIDEVRIRTFDICVFKVIQEIEPKRELEEFKI